MEFTNKINLDRLADFSRYLGILYQDSEFKNWLHSGALLKKYPLTELYRELKKETEDLKDLKSIKRTFRKFKQRHFLRLGARDFLQNISFEDLVLQISYIAEVTLQVGFEILISNPHLFAYDIQNFDNLKDCQFTIIGLGKLGGKELNYSSDIDLIYIYHPKDSIAQCKIYTNLALTLNSIIGDMFEGDRVFNVDMRLRPKGRYGELVQSYDTVVEHYLLSGQAWERQALIKARGVAGGRNLATDFLKEIRPFVFRRFLDFQALEEIRSMRDKILKETETKGGVYPENVKLGIGGIREVEFIVQAFQLIYGGRYPELMEPNTLVCLEKLEQLNLLSEEIKHELRNSYIFLRRVEHWIQLDRNRQSSTLPKNKEDLERLARSMYFSNEKEFFEALTFHAQKVHSHFKELFSKNTKKSQKAHIKENANKFYVIIDGKESISIKYFSTEFREKISGLLNDLNETLSLDAFYGCSKRIGSFLDRVARRPGLVKYLEDNIDYTIEALSAVGRSRFIHHLLTHQPSLIEGVIEYFYTTDNWMEYATNILTPLSFDEAIEWIRKIKNERLLYLSILDIKGDISIENLLKELSYLAEFVITQTYNKILDLMNIPKDFPLAILALGKLGSKELGYFSDLDLMYVYEPMPNEDPNLIPDLVVKIIQRFNNMLKIPMQEGPGYEVDTRLRPTGNYGPLVVTYKRWRDYYEHEADIWEIQSLTKLRPITGNSELCKRIRENQREILLKNSDEKLIWEKIIYMRDKIIAERAQEKENVVDLKVGKGGLTDLEFFIQGMLLTHKIPLDLDLDNVTNLYFSLLATNKAEDFANMFKEIYRGFLYIIQRIQLLTNLGTSKISKDKFLDACQMGLWPPHNYFLIEDWEDLIKFKNMVSRFWENNILTIK